MTNKIDGGPAFPQKGFYEEQESGHLKPQFGMSLRDWFAGMALSGMLACSREGDAHQAWLSPSAAAEWAYEIADAMLAERSKNAQP